MAAAKAGCWLLQADAAAFPKLAESFALWARLLEQQAGGEFVLPQGAEFGGATYWWGKRRARPSPHEGVDFCRVRGSGSVVAPVQVGFCISAVADGMVVAVFEDFLGRTIVMRHDEEFIEVLLEEDMAKNLHIADAGEDWVLHTLLGHVDPAAGVAPGIFVQASSIVAAISASKTAAPAHAHVSLVAAPRSFAWSELSSWPELHARSAARELAFLDPPLQLRREEPEGDADEK